MTRVPYYVHFMLFVGKADEMVVYYVVRSVSRLSEVRAFFSLIALRRRVTVEAGEELFVATRRRLCDRGGARELEPAAGSNPMGSGSSDGRLGWSPCVARHLVCSLRLARTGSAGRFRSSLRLVVIMLPMGVEIVLFFQNADGANPETRRDV